MSGSGNTYKDKEGFVHQNLVVTVQKHHPNAEPLSKDEETHAGLELTVIGRDENRVDDIVNDVNVFTTGLSLSVPPNFHAEIVEHPQLYKTGYSLVGGPRIINPKDDSEILIPLFKFKEAEDLELPFRAAIVIFRPTVYIGVVMSSQVGGYDDEEEEEEVPKPKKKSVATRKGRGKNKDNHMF